MKIVHFSDYGSQPEIRVACSQKYYHPWTQDKSLPEGIHQADDLLYTFGAIKVTCDECKKLDSWKLNYASERRYKAQISMSGYSEDDYNEKMTDLVMHCGKINTSFVDSPVPGYRRVSCEELDKIWMAEDNIDWSMPEYKSKDYVVIPITCYNIQA